MNKTPDGNGYDDHGLSYWVQEGEALDPHPLENAGGTVEKAYTVVDYADDTGQMIESACEIDSSGVVTGTEVQDPNRIWTLLSETCRYQFRTCHKNFSNLYQGLQGSYRFDLEFLELAN